MGKHCQVTCNICNRNVRSNNLPRHLRTHGIGGKGSNEIRSNSRNNINPDDLIDTSVALQTYPSYQNRFEKFDIRLKKILNSSLLVHQDVEKYILCRTLLKILKHFLNNLLQLLSMSTKYGKQNLMR